MLKKIGDEKAGIRDTGREPYQDVKFDQNDQIICEILGDKRLGLEQFSKYDDNGK